MSTLSGSSGAEAIEGGESTSLPDGWSEKALSDVVTLQRGFDLPAQSRTPGPFPVLTSGSGIDFHSEGPVSGPGFVVGRATNLGKPKWSDRDFWPHNTTMYAKDFKGNDPRWLYHLFEVTDLTGYNSGSVQPMLNRNYIASVRVRVPPLADQNRIAEVLRVLDDKIAANRQIVEISESLLDATIMPLLQHEALLWEKVDFLFGEAFRGSEFTESGEGRPLIRIRDLRSQKCQVWTSETRKRERIVRAGEVLVGMDAEFRATRWAGPTGVLNQRVLLASSETYGDAVTSRILRAPLAGIERSKSGTTVIHLNKSDLEQMGGYVPHEASVEPIRELVDPIWQQITALETESTRLAATRDELLPLLMSGKITVKDAEKRVEQEV